MFDCIKMSSDDEEIVVVDAKKGKKVSFDGREFE